MMITGTIHQIWIGPKPAPFHWIKTWQDKNPALTHCLWTEEDIDHLDLINRDKYDYYMDREMYDGAADVARVEILEQIGGVYIDADSICLRPIQDLAFMHDKFFAVIEYDRRVANGTIGSVPHHPILKDYIERIKEAVVLEPPCYTIGGTMFTSCIDSYGRQFVTLLPTYMFYPKRGVKYKGRVYARQMWGTTKNLYGQNA